MAILDLDLPPTSHAGGDEYHQRHGKQDLVGEEDDHDLSKGVRHLCQRGGITRLPVRYVLPPSQRPSTADSLSLTTTMSRLPVIDLARLKTTEAAGDRAAALAELDAACRDYGFFQVVNHGVDVDATRGVLDVARRFFDQRSRYASSDIRAPVRYGTSFNQLNDGVLCWRDFLKLVVSDDGGGGASSSWPDAPVDLREVVSAYARASQRLFRDLMEAALLGSSRQDKTGTARRRMLEGCDAGSQMLVVNCYPACPESDLTLGMPPHSDYGLLTVLL